MSTYEWHEVGAEGALPEYRLASVADNWNYAWLLRRHSRWVVQTWGTNPETRLGDWETQDVLFDTLEEAKAVAVVLVRMK
jgi:hypothetical protein